MPLVARWSFDAKFGLKPEAIEHLKKWTKDIGVRAGLKDNWRLLTGSVGAPESRVVFEMEIDDLTGLDTFFKNIPGADHVAWGKEMGEYIIDGSTNWETYRIL